MEIVLYLVYLIASVCFIFGIKKLSSPKTARQGNQLAALGMLLAIVVTLLDQRILTFEYIILGIVVGSAIGAVMAIKVQMTGMPQMVGLLNGFGGGASALVAFAEYDRIFTTTASFEIPITITIVLSI